MNLNNKKSIDIQLNIEAEETIKKIRKDKAIITRYNRIR